MEWLIALITGQGGIIGVVVIFFIIRQIMMQGKDIPPLDLVDAKKLDDMVARQVEDYLKPLLSSKGYTDDEIKEILVRTSAGGKRFRR